MQDSGHSTNREKESDVSEQVDMAEPDMAESRPKKHQRGLDVLAMRELRSARKLFKDGASSAAEVNYLVASANVLATLDLAAAIREAGGVSGR
jgi:hypothetical protein